MADIKRIPFGAPNRLGEVMSFSNQVLDATGEKIAFVFTMPEAGTLTDFAFRYGARTGTPPTYAITLEGVDASGLPDGTDVGGGSPTAATFTPPADTTWNGTWRKIALTNSYAATRGQMLALVIDYSTGTISAAHNSSFSYDDLGVPRAGIPYALIHNGTSWTKQSTAFPVYAVYTATKCYGRPSETATTTDVTIDGRRAALKFTLPAGSGDTLTCIGARMSFRCEAAGSWIFALWNAGGVLQTRTLDTDAFALNGSGNRFTELYFTDASLSALSFGTAYYLGVERTGSTIQLPSLGVDTSVELDALPGGSEWHLATFDGTSWSDDQTNRPFIEPIFADITEPAGGGGLVAPIMSTGGGLIIRGAA